ncbi:hypothetical protein VTN02DRAFT_1065 [Thermoascus thermophilus]
MQCQLFGFIAIVVAVFVQTTSAKPVPVTQGNMATSMKERPLYSSAECANGARFAVQSPSPLLSWTRCDGNESPSVQKRQLLPIPYLSNELWHGGSGGVQFAGNEKDMPVWHIADNHERDGL